MSTNVFVDKIGVAQWISWAAATFVACVLLTAFCYQNFETKSDAREKKADIVERLNRIETKLDDVIVQKRK